MSNGPDLSEQSDKEDADEENSDNKGTPKGRKKIRKIIDDENLRAETQEALREEEERCKRLAKYRGGRTYSFKENSKN